MPKNTDKLHSTPLYLLVSPVTRQLMFTFFNFPIFFLWKINWIKKINFQLQFNTCFYFFWKKCMNTYFNNFDGLVRLYFLRLSFYHRIQNSILYSAFMKKRYHTILEYEMKETFLSCNRYDDDSNYAKLIRWFHYESKLFLNLFFLLLASIYNHKYWQSIN